MPPSFALALLLFCSCCCCSTRCAFTCSAASLNGSLVHVLAVVLIAFFTSSWYVLMVVMVVKCWVNDGCLFWFRFWCWGRKLSSSSSISCQASSSSSSAALTPVCVFVYLRRRCYISEAGVISVIWFRWRRGGGGGGGGGCAAALLVPP